MAIHYKMSIEEAEKMTPWEMEYYVDLTMEHVRKLNEARSG